MASQKQPGGKAFAVERELARLAEELEAQGRLLQQVLKEQASASDRLDRLLLGVAAFQRGGAVLILSRPLEEQLIPASLPVPFMCPSRCPSCNAVCAGSQNPHPWCQSIEHRTGCEGKAWKP